MSPSQKQADGHEPAEAPAADAVKANAPANKTAANVTGDTAPVIISVAPLRRLAAAFYDLLLLTSAGWIKKTPIEAFAKIRASGLTALKFTSEGDTVYRAALCAEGDSVVLASRLGQTLRFQCDEKQLRASGRTSRGVKSMVLRDGDAIVDMAVIDADSGSGKGKQRLLSVTDEGYGKRVLVSQFLPKGRGGKGMIGLKFKNDNDRLAALRVPPKDERRSE